MSGRLKGLNDKTLGRSFWFLRRWRGLALCAGFGISAQAACSDPGGVFASVENCDKKRREN